MTGQLPQSELQRLSDPSPAVLKPKSRPEKGQLLVALLGGSLIVLALAYGVYLLGQSGQKHVSGTNPTPQPTEAQPTPSPTTPLTQLACVERLPDSIKVAQKLMFAGYATLLTTEEASVSRATLGGIIMMNQASLDELTTFRGQFGIPPLIGVDQEGGSVQRYTSEGKFPGAAEMSAEYSADQAYQLYLKDAKFLKSMGLTTNFGPVVDVISRQPVPLPGRLYSSDPSQVVAYAKRFVQAMKDAGLTPVIKHFPGLGSASGNTDMIAATTDPLSVLQNRDLLPYQQLAAAKSDVMVSNAIVPGLTDGQPAIWSAKAVSLLRSYGYANSVIYTDSLTAKAVPGTLANAAIASWQADVDMAMVVQTLPQTTGISGMINPIINQATQALADGQLDRAQLNQSVLRILNRKNVNPCSINLN